MEDIQNYLAENPIWAGLLMSGVGIFFLLASIYDWDFLFGGESPNEYNLQKIEGLVNFYGRKPVRIFYGIGGVVLTIGGVFWGWFYTCY